MKKLVIASALAASMLFSSVVSFADGEWWREGFNYVYYSSPKIMDLDEPENVFHPNRDVTRKEVADALWRLDGKPSVSGSKFWDVSSDSNAVQFVSGSGIMNGVDDRHFDPDGLITREQMATIAYRFAKNCGCGVSIPTKIDKQFNDYNQISDYAWGAVVWAVNSGIMTGTDTGFEPKMNLNRGQIATIIMRLGNLTNKKSSNSGSSNTPSSKSTVDKSAFVKSLGDLLKQTDVGLIGIDYYNTDGKEYITLHYQDSDERVSIQNSTYADIVVKVVESVLL